MWSAKGHSINTCSSINTSQMTLSFLFLDKATENINVRLYLQCQVKALNGSQVSSSPVLYCFCITLLTLQDNKNQRGLSLSTLTLPQLLSCCHFSAFSHSSGNTQKRATVSYVVDWMYSQASSRTPHVQGNGALENCDNTRGIFGCCLRLCQLLSNHC